MADMRFIRTRTGFRAAPPDWSGCPRCDYVLEHAGTEEFISNYLAALRPVLEATAAMVKVSTPPSQLVAPVVSIVP